MTLLTERPSTVFPAPAVVASPAPAEWRGLARDDVRLLIARPDGIIHARFRELGAHLRRGDLLVVNDSATEPRELDAVVPGTAADRPVVAHLAQPVDAAAWVVELRTAPDAGRPILDAAPGTEVIAGPVHLRLLAPYPATSSPTGRGNRLWRAEVRGDIRAELARVGRPIAYGYLDRRFPLTAYQTVFGVRPGSAEMPSAARPFSHPLVTGLIARGIQLAPITLHTGVSSQESGEAPLPEWFQVTETTARLVRATQQAGGRVIAVGTTVTRALESAVEGGVPVAARGWTDRVITPGRPPQVVDGLITGWHDPHASHLLLVEAVAGRALTQAAYDAAVAEGYLWHEFGDVALLLP